MEASGYTREALRALLVEEVRRLAPRGLPSDRWTLEVALLARTRELESTTVSWTGIRRESPEVRRVGCFAR